MLGRPSSLDSVGRAGGVVTGGSKVPLSSELVQSVGFACGNDMILKGKSVDNHLVNNATSNSGPSTQNSSSSQEDHPSMVNPTTKELVSCFCCYPNPSLEKSKYFKNSTVIQSTFDSFKVLWEEFDEVKHISTTQNLQDHGFFQLFSHEKRFLDKDPSGYQSPSWYLCSSLQDLPVRVP